MNLPFFRNLPPCHKGRRPWIRALCLCAGICALLLLPGAAGAGNVILFVGDGMGLAQREAARLAAGGPDGRLAMDTLPHTCLVITHSASGLTTDSAAGATAWSTGHRTHNAYLGVTPDGTPVETILEYARDAGLGTGLVTTTSLSHATPAAFAAHISDRHAEAEIARQMLAARPNLMLGGGRAFWVPQSHPSSKRKDQLDLLEAARTQGYAIARTAAELQGLDLKRSVHLLGLFAWNHLSYVYDRQQEEDPEPSLAAMTAAAITMLEKFRPGFFLMVEGGRIDHAAHSDDPDRTIWETIAFDEAVARGIDYATREGRTLLIVVADHETGGMSVGNAAYEGFPDIPREHGWPARSVDLGRALSIGWTTKGHTSIPVIAGAMGPGAEKFSGMLDNTDLFALMLEALGLEEGREQ